MADKHFTTTDGPRDFGEAIDPNMPWNRRKREAGRPAPQAFMVTKLDGTGRRIIDAAKYDPRDEAFWISAEAQAAHVVTPLCPPSPQPNVVGPIAWTTQAALEDLKSNPHRMAVMSGHPLEYADSAPVALYDHRPQTVSEGETVTRFRIEWVAGARPPAHPTPMTGKAWAATFEDAIAHMRAQASDAQFVSLSEVVTTTIKSDRSDDLRAALATTEGRE